ncbi:SPOSA6832_02373 [Sporobolomyces salmonicolor]|uniref:SPOSA6832_02373-mRNA-1:cds n=1 Tax=Sporidiobolus salmonicolor TaxID=5005 RepID=A0A0D6EM06_SPOSA|nr:SPOSA6832_02373 [Sporobolomyces salmonicolor]
MSPPSSPLLVHADTPSARPPPSPALSAASTATGDDDAEFQDADGGGGVLRSDLDEERDHDRVEEPQPLHDGAQHEGPSSPSAKPSTFDDLSRKGKGKAADGVAVSDPDEQRFEQRFEQPHLERPTLPTQDDCPDHSIVEPDALSPSSSCPASPPLSQRLTTISFSHEDSDVLSSLTPSSSSTSPSSRFIPPKRPFSLSSEPPETPTVSSSQLPTSSSAHSLVLHAPSPPGVADPTNVGRGSSPSLTQVVWRNSMGLSSPPPPPSRAAAGLVDVNLDADETTTLRKRKSRASILEEDDEHDDEHSTGLPSDPQPQRRSQLVSQVLDRARQGSMATQHGDDGFLARHAHDVVASYSESGEIRAAGGGPEGGPGVGGADKLRASFVRVRERSQEQEGSPGEKVDWDFWGRVMSDYEEVARAQPRELSRAIQKGIPPALRGMTWQLMAAAKDPTLESVYSSLLKQKSPHEKSIARDLSRTFPKHEYFADNGGVGQENLFNVVKAYSLYDEEVGYTQGLQFIVGPLLLNMPDEESFCVLVRLMKSYDLRSHYTPNMPGLQLRLFQFDRLVEELLPGVFLHLLRQGVKSSMYASQWFLTLFGYRFPLELVSCVFDLVFAEGVEAIFRFAVALLKRNEAYLCTLEFEDLIEFLKNGLFEGYAPTEEELEKDPNALYHAHDFVHEALQDQFGEEWFHLCTQQNAHTAELDALRKANLQLSLQVRQLEASLSQINTEHCELVKQVVNARLEREELEDELVKYKIAYAQAALEAASDRASMSPLSLRRQSEMSTSSVLLSGERNSTSTMSSRTVSTGY